MFTTKPENERVIAKLVERLDQLPVGGVVTYEELSKLVERDILKQRYLLARARTHAEKKLQCIFAAVNALGIRRVPPEDAPEIGAYTIRVTRRRLNRERTRLGWVQSNSLPREQMQRIGAYCAMMGAAALVLDLNKARTIAAVIDPVKPIPPEDILRMFVKDETTT